LYLGQGLRKLFRLSNLLLVLRVGYAFFWHTFFLILDSSFGNRNCICFVIFALLVQILGLTLLLLPLDIKLVDGAFADVAGVAGWFHLKLNYDWTS
jgi:hypothetical protein